jgi:hypothetical protein
MKKNRETVSIVLLIMMLLDIIIVTNLAWVGMAIADPNTVTSAEFVIGLNQYFVNNQVPGIGMDAAPYIDSSSGRTLIPVRYLANAVGAQTAWAGTTQTVTVTGNGMTISMVIGNTALTVNDQAQTLDQAPVINNGRTYLPARWVAQALGYNVDWDATNQIVIIWNRDNIGEPSYNNVTLYAQQNATKPWEVQKLENALGITMTGGDGGWAYDPTINADGSTNTTFVDQYVQNKETFVTASYGERTATVDIECSQAISDPGTVTFDITPIQKVLQAFFPGVDISQAINDALQKADDVKTHHGWSTTPGYTLTINGTKVTIGGGGVDFIILMIYD